MGRYTSTLDKTSTILTWSITGFGAVIFIIEYIAYLESGKQAVALIASFIGPAILLALTVSMYYLMPLAIVTSDSGITIERKVKPVTINYPDIKAIRMVADGEMSGVIRTFGNGGLFGYTGMYYNTRLGSMTWYCTQHKNYILIDKTNNKRIVITPDNPEAFMIDVQLRKNIVL